MTVKIKRVDGNIEIFHTDQYIVGPKKIMHGGILDVKVYAGGKMIVHKKRLFQKFYTKFLYKPEKQELKPEEEKQN